MKVLPPLDLVELQNFLLKIYLSSQLIASNTTHLFELPNVAKLGIVGTDETITFSLQIPILKPFI